MASQSTTAFRVHLKTLFQHGALGGRDDAELLELFLADRAGRAEAAFRVLVERHGPMVVGVCQGVLGNPHDAEDASQAVFLVLARRAGAVRRRESLASWLFGVARRVAARAKRDTSRRRRHEQRWAATVGRNPEVDAASGPWEELYAEIERLPEWARAAVVLCHLEGLTHEQAAGQVGCPLRTFQSRLLRARARLRAQMTRKGLTLEAIAGAFVRPEPPLAGWVDSTVLGTVRFLAGETAVESVSATAVALTEGVLRMMFLTKLKMVAVVVLVLVIGAGGGTALSYQASGDKPGDAPVAKSEAPKSSISTTEDLSGQPKQPETDSSGRLRSELYLLSTQLKRKQVELEKALAERELRQARVATNARLNVRRPGMVSQEEVRMTEAEAKLAGAQVDLAQVEVQEAEHRLAQAKLLEGDPRQLREFLDRWSSTDRLALENRLRDVERKLEQILKGMDLANPANPVGDFGGRKPR